MTKQEFIRAYQFFCMQFALRPEEAIISAGGVLLMVGLRRETEDLDLDIPAAHYDRLAKIGQVVRSVMGEYVVIRNYSLHRGIDKKIETTMFEGVCCYSLKEVLKQKERIRRPAGDPKIEQDKKDIAALKKMINRH